MPIPELRITDPDSPIRRFQGLGPRPRRWTGPGSWNRPWRRRWSYRSCGSSGRSDAGGHARCYCWCGSRRWCNCWRSCRSWGRCGYLSTGKYSHIINVLFVSADGLRVFVKRGGICHVASGIVRHNGDVIAYLLILWKASLRIKRITHRNIGGPRRAAVRAE